VRWKVRTAQPRETVIRVADWYETCSTRDRAQRFYPHLLALLDAATPEEKVVLSFEEVDFVSPSFLDEILVRLAEDRPSAARRLEIRHVSPFVRKRLRSILAHRNLLEFEPQETHERRQLA